MHYSYVSVTYTYQIVLVVPLADEVMQLSQLLAGGNGQLALHCQLAQQHLHLPL